MNTEAGPRIILRLPQRWLTRYTISEEISPKLCGIGLGFGPGVTFAADQNFGANPRSPMGFTPDSPLTLGSHSWIVGKPETTPLPRTCTWQANLGRILSSFNLQKIREPTTL